MGEWLPRQAIDIAPFKQGQSFTLEISGNPSGYTMTAKGKDLGFYPARLPLTSIRSIYVEGGMIVTHLNALILAPSGQIIKQLDFYNS